MAHGPGGPVVALVAAIENRPAGGDTNVTVEVANVTVAAGDITVQAVSADSVTHPPVSQRGPGAQGRQAFQWQQRVGIEPPADVSVIIPAAATVTVTANNSSATVAPTIGSAAVTVTGNNATTSGNVNVTVGSAAVTVTSNNSSSAVAHAVGNAAVTVTANNAAASTATNVAVGVATIRVTATFAQNKWPTSVSSNGRYILDQNGNPWMMHGDSGWDLPVNISFENAAVFIDDRASRGVNLILAYPFDHFFSTSPPANYYGDSPFTGTAFQSGLTPAFWAHVDKVIDYASMRGITILFFPAYLGLATSEEGWDTEIVAASNAQMDTLGTTLGDRYETYSNLIWVAGGDRTPSATELDRLDHLFTSIASAGDTHLVTAHSAGASDSAASWNSYSWLDLNAVYARELDVIPTAATAYGRATVRPTFFIEGRYYNYSGATLAAVRAEQWRVVLVGGLGGHISGNEAIWSFGVDTGISSGGYDWQARLTDASITHSQLIRTLFDTTVTANVWKTLAPDLTDTFLTAGESSGTTQAAASFNTHCGLVYVATTGSITVDLTELSGAATVLARWFDPTNGSFTAISTYSTSAPQTITHPGTNAAGGNDWVLTLVDATVNVTVGSATVTVTGNNATVSTTSNVNVTVGSAAVTVTANNPSHSVAVGLNEIGGVAYVYGDSLSNTGDTGSAVAHAVGSAAVTVTGNNATVSTTSNVNVTVGSAAVTTTGNNVDHAIAPTIGTAAVTVTGNNATVSTTSNVNVAVGVAAVTVVGNDATHTIASTIGVATVTVAGNNATISTDSSKQVTVGTAVVTATGNNSSSSVKPTTQLASVTVTAGQVTTAHELTVGSAAVTATTNAAHAAVAATVAYALVAVLANNLQPDNGEGVATLIGMIRASRPDIHRTSRPYPHRAQRPEV